MSDRHICDEFCLCPHHEMAMHYSKSLDSHACPDMQCEYAHGFEAVWLEQVSRQGRIAKRNRQDLDVAFQVVMDGIGEWLTQEEPPWGGSTTTRR